jgi:hypothetical protein
MKKIANQIRKFLKDNGINAQVKVQGDLLIIDNLEYNWAAGIAKAATGLEFIHMSNSMTKLAS